MLHMSADKPYIKPKLKNMKKLIPCFALLLFLYSCNNTQNNSPKSIVNSFINAGKKGDMEGLKKYITKSDLDLMQMGESMMAKFDSSGSNKMKDKMTAEFKEKTKNARAEAKDEKIDGDKAVVNVEFVNDGKSQLHPFNLIKEDGQWKISLLSSAMKNAGANNQDLKNAMQSINIDSIKGAMGEGIAEFNKMNKDSLKLVIEQAMKEVKKLQDSSK